MQETIANVVLQAMTQVNVVTDEDRANFQEAYGYPVAEAGDEAFDEDEDYYYGEVGGYGIDVTVTTRTVTLGGEVLGDRGDDNSDFAALITQGLILEGDVSQKDQRKVYRAVLEVLNSFPKKVVNGREQNYFVGTPQQFSQQVAEKVEDTLTSKGLLGNIASFLKLRK